MPGPTRPSSLRRALSFIATIVFMAAVTIAFRRLTAAGEGEKCGGATGCATGLVCVQLSVPNVVENRRCRQTCTSDAGRGAGRGCVRIGGTTTSACLEPSDLR